MSHLSSINYANCDGSSDELEEHRRETREIEDHDIDEMGDFEDLEKIVNDDYSGLEEESA